MVKAIKLHDTSYVSGDMLGVSALPVGDTIVGIAASQTLTNKTITAPILSGSVTGTYTLAGTPTISSPTITAPVISGAGSITGLSFTDTKRSTADFTATSGDTAATLTNLTGLTGFSLAASGVYEFDVDLQCVCTTNSGISVAFKHTTLTLTSIAINHVEFAAASMASGRSTTTTDQQRYVNTKAAAWLSVKLKGTLVVNAGGTLAIQASQESSHADATTVYAGSSATFKRIA